MYEDLCAEDEDAAARTLKVLVPDSFAADTRRKSTRATQARGSEFMEAALMLRKLQAAALAAHGEGAKRALVRLDSCSKSLEHAAIACFDAAMARCEDDTVVGGLASALLDMRAAGDALLYLNCGATTMQRYVSTRKPFIDPQVIIGDREAVDNIACYPDAAKHTQRVVDEMLVFVAAESRLLPHIFANEHMVMLMLLQRLCYERLEPMVHGVMARLSDLHDDDDSSEISEKLDCVVEILRSVASFVAGLEAGVHNSGPLADKQVREEISDILDDILAPHVQDFVPQQLAALSGRLALFLPTITPAHTVEFVTDEPDLELAAHPDGRGVQTPLLRARGGRAHSGEDAEGGALAGVESESGLEAQHANTSQEEVPTAGARGGDTEMGGARAGNDVHRGRAMAWASKKRQQLSLNLRMPRHLPSASLNLPRHLSAALKTKAEGSELSTGDVGGADDEMVLRVSVSCMHRGVEETRRAIDRVMAVIGTCKRHTQRTQAPLDVLSTYIEAYSGFLHGLVKRAADLCRLQVQQAHESAPDQIEAPRAAFFAVAGADALHQMVSASVLTAAAASDVQVMSVLSRMLSDSDAWTTGALHELISAMLQAALEGAAQCLQAPSLKNEYQCTDDRECQTGKRCTDACLRCVRLVRSVAVVWLINGPTSRHGRKAADAESILHVKTPLDANTLWIFAELANSVLKLVRNHVSKFRYTPHGAMRLLHDIAAFQQLAHDLGAPPVEHALDSMAQAANTLVVNAANLEIMLQDQTALPGEAQVLQDMLDMISLRSDWHSLRSKLGAKVSALRTQAPRRDSLAPQHATAS